MAASNLANSFVECRIIHQSDVVGPNSGAIHHILSTYFVYLSSGEVLEDDPSDLSFLIFDQLDQLAPINSISRHK